MKINFLDDKSVVSEQINISNIKLSCNNPRFTVLPSLTTNLADFIKQKSSSDYEVIIKLIGAEGNLNDFIRLLESIKNNGFKNKNEPIIITSDNKDNYFIAEGNRRVLCLKLIAGVIVLPEKKFFLNQNYSNYSNENDEKLVVEDENIDNTIEAFTEFSENYDKIVKLINEIQAKFSSFNVSYRIVNNSEDLWKNIYDKHLTGERPGMRKWSRAKYYADLLNIFAESGINDSIKERQFLFNNINREFSFIVKDFQEAQYIYLCFWYGLKKNSIENGINNFLSGDNEIIEKLIFTNNISSLERIFSWNKIKAILKGNEFNHSKISNSDFDKKFIDLDFDKNNKITLAWGLLEPHKIFAYIYKLWNKGNITTRSIKNIDEVVKSLKLMIKNVNINTQLSYQQIVNLNEFDFTISDLDKIINVNSLQKDGKVLAQLERFKLAKSVKEKISEIKDDFLEKHDFEKIEPIDVFLRLREQLTHNMSTKKFLNATAATLRSFWEQITIWLWLKYNKINNHNVELNDGIDEFANGKTNKLFNQIRDELTNDDNLLIMLIKVFLDISPSNDVFKKYFNFLKSFVNKSGRTDSNNTYAALCNFVHASHRIYIEKSYVDNLIILERAAEMSKEIIDTINFNELFSDINGLIIQKIKI